MKTIVARFTEMKKAPGDIVEVDGEEISVNKVEAALKSVGVQLRDTQGQFRELDDVFLELASKWDSLDVMSQRYVATMAAGSRQQSRFIAMMSNYQRTMELTSYATNSAGASQEQFEKTMDSLESKLNRLHDAWEQYVTGIANQSAVKGAVDLLTELLETVNNVTDALDPFHTGWSKILAAFLGFKAAKGVVNNVLRGIGTQLGTRKPDQTTVPGGEPTKTGLDEKQGTVDGTKYGKGFWGAFQKMQAQKRGDLKRPITDELKSKKQNLKNAKQAASLKQEATQMKAQSQQLKTLSNDYNKYNQTLSEATKGKEKYQKFNKGELESLKKSNLALQQREEQYRRSLPFESKAYQASEARTVALKKQEAEMVKGYNVQQLKNQQDAIGNAQTTINTEATNLNAAAIDNETRAEEMNVAVTETASKAQMIENIHTEAASMTRMQAIAGLFSLNRQKKLAAMEALGLASATEVEAITTGGATAAQTAFNAALYACPIMWIIAAVAALVAGLVILAVVLSNQETAYEKQEKAAKNATKAAEDAAEQATKTKEAYDDLLENKNTYNQLYEEIQKLGRGTAEFKNKALELKEVVNDLLAKYPKLYDYTKFENGVLTISDAGFDLIEKEQLKATSASAMAAAAAASYSAAQNYKTRSMEYTNKYISYRALGSTESNDTWEYVTSPLSGPDSSLFDGHFVVNTDYSPFSKTYRKELADYYKENKDSIRFYSGKVLESDQVPEDFVLLNSKDSNGNIVSQVVAPSSIDYFTKGYQGTLYTDALGRKVESFSSQDDQKGLRQDPIVEKPALVEFSGGVVVRELEDIRNKSEEENLAAQKIAYQYKNQMIDQLITLDNIPEDIIENYIKYTEENSVDSFMDQADKIEEKAKSLQDKGYKYLLEEYRNIFQVDFDLSEYDIENEEDQKKVSEEISNIIAAYQTFGTIINGNITELKNVTDNFNSEKLVKYGEFLKLAVGDMTRNLSTEFIETLLQGTEEVKEYFEDLENIEISDQDIKDAIKIVKDQFNVLKTFFDLADNELSTFISKVGANNAYNLASVFTKMRSSTGYNYSKLFKQEYDLGLFSTTENISEFITLFDNINWQSPVDAANALNNIDGKFSSFAQKVKMVNAALLSTKEQFKEVFQSIDNDTWEELTEDSIITGTEIEELKDKLPIVSKALKNTGISANTLATYLDKVRKGLINANETSLNFVAALNKISAASNNTEESLNFIKNFEPSDSFTEIGEGFAEIKENMKQALERGQYGDQQLIDYTKMILGLDKYEEYYTEYNGNLQKIEELAYNRINSFGQNFYGFWKELASQTNAISLTAEGGIQIDLSNFSSLDDFKKYIIEKMGVSEEFAKAAIADAQTYSSNLTQELSKLSIGDSLVELLKGAQKDLTGKKFLLDENELRIIAEQSGKDFDFFKEEIIAASEEAGIEIEIGTNIKLENGKLSEKDITNYLNNIKEQIEERGKVDFSEIYQNLLATGLSPEEAQKQIRDFLERLRKLVKNKTLDFEGSELFVTGDKTAEKGIQDSIIDGITGSLKSQTVNAEEDKALLEAEKKTATAIAKGIVAGLKASEQPINDFLTKLGQILTKNKDFSVDISFSGDISKVDDTITEMYSAKENELNNEINKNIERTSQLESKMENFASQFTGSFESGSAEAYMNLMAMLAGVQGGDWPGKDSSSSSNSSWTNDYDIYYNTLKKIEGLERKRTELEKQQSRLTKQRFIDEEKLKANKQEQVKLLKQQARINSDLADTAAAYLRGDSNGDVWFDEVTGTIQTNPNAAYYNEEQMEAFNDQKSLMEDHYETWKEAKDNLEDIYDAIDELTEVAEFSLEDLTDSVDRAIEVLDNTLTNLDREISHLDRYDSGATSSDYKKRYEQSAQTYADKYNQLTTKKAISEQIFNGQIHSDYGKYITYDWDSKEVTKSALYYAITDPDVKNSVDDFVSNTQEIAADIIDMDNQQEEIKDSLYDLQQTLADKSLEFQEKVYDAVIKAREDEITTLNNIDNSIKNAASDLISSVQKNLQKIRQDRQNQDKEEELQNMEARLAYYQVDTSNANQKNILDLQKQLEDKQRSYTDTLIDQKISELQQQNDDAAAQRKKQIEIMETQLELDKENGIIWRAVGDALNTGFNSSGRIQKGSDLYNMLSSLDEVTKKNSVQFERWFGELNNLAAAYNANLTADLDTSGQMSNTVSNANDVYGENSEYIKSLKSRLEAMNRDGNFNHLVWYDQEGQKVKYKYNITYFDNETERQNYDKKVAEYQALARELANARAFYKTNKNASFVSAFNRLYGYDTGGLADYTGLAWLDGTPASPEMVLNSRDTENFIQLKDILNDIMSTKINNDNPKGDYYFEIQIDVDKVTSDYDVDQIADRIKQQITNEARYRNVNVINMIR